MKRRMGFRVRNDEFPKEFTVQRIGMTAAKAIAFLPPALISRYFRQHPAVAESLLHESYDKRFTPSTFLSEEGGGFRVGWFSSRQEYECVLSGLRCSIE
jgi:hypothetical protein